MHRWERSPTRRAAYEIRLVGGLLLQCRAASN
jgi:hypothetical protein